MRPAVLLLALLPVHETPATLSRQEFKQRAKLLAGDRRLFEGFQERSCLAAQILAVKGIRHSDFPCHVSRRELLAVGRAHELAGRLDVQLRVLSPGQLRWLRQATSRESLRLRLEEIRGHYDQVIELAEQTPSLLKTEVPARLKAIRRTLGLTAESLEDRK